MKVTISTFILFFTCFGLFSQELSLVSPLNNNVSEESFVQFVWNPTKTNNATYQLQISNDLTFTSLLVDSLTTFDSLAINLSTVVNTHLYWRVKENLSSAFSAPNHFYVLDIPSFENAAVWLKSDQVLLQNDSVLQWNNLIPSSPLVFEQSDNAKRPIQELNGILDYPYLNFTGGKELSSLDFLLTDKGLSFFAVLTPNNSTSGFNFVYDQGFLGTKGFGVSLKSDRLRTYLPTNFGGNVNEINDSFGNLLLRQTVDFISQTNRIECNNNIDTFFQFTTAALSTTTMNNNYPMKVGGIAKQYSNSNCFKGNMYELVFINDTVYQSTVDQQIIPEYLHQKYAPYPNLGKDYCEVYKLCTTSVDFSVANHFVSQTWSTSATDTFIQVQESGTYFVETIDEFGYELRDTVLVEFPYTTFEDTLIVCPGDTAILYKGLGANYTFDWSDGSSDSLLQVNQSGLFTVTITDTFGCSIFDQTYVIIDSIETNTSLGPDRSFCLGTDLEVETSGKLFHPLSYNWSTGETSNAINLSSSGDSLIFVEIKDAFNCIAYDTILASVNNITAPVVDFASDTACPFDQTNFTDLSLPNGNDLVSTWEWQYNGLVFSTSANPTQPFPDANISVQLTILTDSGCVNQITKPVFLKEVPQTNFNFEIGCATSPIQFNDASTISAPNTIDQWSWLVGSDTLTVSNPNMVFNTSGLFQTRLIATASNGCRDTITKNIEVFPALIPDFTVSNVCIGDTAAFIDNSNSFSIIDREWEFGLFSLSSDETNPTFQYPTPGTYNVKYTITNAIGCVSDTTKEINIRALPQIGMLFENNCIGSETRFFDNSVGNIDQMTWTIETSTFFGDSISYPFPTEDSFDVYHQIIDEYTCVSDTTVEISIHPLPQVDFSFTPNYGTAPLEVQFNNAATGGNTFFWNFGENNASSFDENPTYTYTTNGIYDITLIAENQFFCRDSLVKSIPIIPTELDIEISNLELLETILSDGSKSYTPRILMKNVGSRTIENVDLKASINQETKIAETWSGQLGVGQSALYNFSAFFLIPNQNVIDYVCVEAFNVNDNTEVNVGNNKTCLLEEGEIRFSNLYPNPSTVNTYLDVVTARKGTALLAMYDLLGKEVFKQEEITLSKGFNQLSFNCSNLQSGKYIVKLIYLEEVYSHSLIIRNP